MPKTMGHQVVPDAPSAAAPDEADGTVRYIPEDEAQLLQDKHLHRWASLLERLK